MLNNQNLNDLVQNFINARKSGELDEFSNYHELMEGYRAWQRENILDLDKLKGYSDAEYAEVFGEMFDNSDGTASSHSLNRGMHFKSDESRLAVRRQFENMVGFIVDKENDRFELLSEIKKPDSPYKVPGIGDHIITTLVNAMYPDVPPVNGTTREFFANIGEPLPTSDTEAQRIVSDLFKRIVDTSHDELNFDDANMILWFTRTCDSGRKFMEDRFNATFENKVRKGRTRAASRKVLTHDEQVAEIYAHLKAIQEQANGK